MRRRPRTLLALLTYTACTGADGPAPMQAAAGPVAATPTPAAAPIAEPSPPVPPECRPRVGPAGPLPAGWAFAESDEAWLRLARELAVPAPDAPAGLVVTPPVDWTRTVLSPNGKYAAFIDGTSLLDSDRFALLALTPAPRVLRRIDGPDHAVSLGDETAVLATQQGDQMRVEVLALPDLGERAATVVPLFGALRVSADGRIIVLSRERELVVHDGASLVELRRLTLDEPARLHGLSDDGATLLVRLPDRVLLLDTTSGKTLARAPGEARAATLAPDGAHFAVASDDGVVVRTRAGKLVHKIAMPRGTSGVAFVAADELLISQDESTLQRRLTDAEQTQLPGIFMRDDDVARRDDGTLVVLGDHGGVRLISGDRVVEPLTWDYGADGAGFDPAGRSFATTSTWGLSWYDADTGVRLARLLHDASSDIVAIAGRTLWIESDAGVMSVALVDGRPTASFHPRTGEYLPAVAPGVALDANKVAGCNETTINWYGEVAADCRGTITIWRDQCSEPWRTPLPPGARLGMFRGRWVGLRTITDDHHDAVTLLSPAGAVAFTYAEEGDLAWGPLTANGRWGVVHREGRGIDTSLLVDVKAQQTRDLPSFATILGFLDDTRAVYRLDDDELRIVRLE